EILLIHVAGMTNDEGLHARISIFGRPGDKPKATDHVATHDVVQGPAGSRRSLLCQDLEIISVVRCALAAPANTVASAGCLSDEFTKRTRLFTLCGRPIEAVLLPGLADNALGISFHASARAILLRIFALRIDIRQGGLNRVELVSADAAEEDLLTAGGGIELPHSVLADERYRKWKIIVSDNHGGLVVAIHLDLMFCIIGRDIFLTCFGIGDFIARRNNVLAVGAQYSFHGFRVACLGRAGQGGGRFFWRFEGLLGAGDRCGCAKECRYRQWDQNSVHRILVRSP